VIPVAAGVALGLLFVAWQRRRPPGPQRRGYAVALVVASAIYLAFALPTLDARWLLVEAGGVALFAALAWLGWARSGWWLSAGWLAHVGWDLLLHGGGEPGFVPAWYPLLCTGFDPVLAAAIGWGRREGGPERAGGPPGSAGRA
jgi:hypothetical protein